MSKHISILMDKFPTFWPIDGEYQAVFPESSTVTTFHPVERNEIPADVSDSDDPSKIHLQNITNLQTRRQRGYRDKCPYWQQWRQLLICQPPIEALELIQEVNRRVGGTLEFRAVIPCPGELRIGLLYDAVRHWDEVQRGQLKLLWNRRTGDLAYCGQIYVDNFQMLIMYNKANLGGTVLFHCYLQ